MLIVLGVVNGVPLNREEKCDRIDNELFRFRNYISNSSNFVVVIDSVMLYFNTSSLYTPILVEKITELCSKTKEVKN